MTPSENTSAFAEYSQFYDRSTLPDPTVMTSGAMYPAVPTISLPIKAGSRRPLGVLVEKVRENAAPEVGELHFRALVATLENDILRLDVQMIDVLLMAGQQSLADLPNHTRRFVL